MFLAVLPSPLSMLESAHFPCCCHSTTGHPWVHSSHAVSRSHWLYAPSKELKRPLDNFILSHVHIISSDSCFRVDNSDAYWENQSSSSFPTERERICHTVWASVNPSEQQLVHLKHARQCLPLKDGDKPMLWISELCRCPCTVHSTFHPPHLNLGTVPVPIRYFSCLLFGKGFLVLVGLVLCLFPGTEWVRIKSVLSTWTFAWLFIHPFIIINTYQGPSIFGDLCEAWRDD